jgi:hypothetical protein
MAVSTGVTKKCAPLAWSIFASVLIDCADAWGDRSTEVVIVPEIAANLANGG